MTRRLWTKHEQAKALELYLRTPFGRIHSRNPEIIELAKILGRTTGALALKMVNFAALDPTVPQKGMSNFSKSDAEIWAEFFAAPSTFIENISKTREQFPFDGEYDLGKNYHPDFEVREGEDVERVVKTRKNQSYFRNMLIASYEGRCAVTGIQDIELLTASHIKPWNDDDEARLDPRNGILLNALHDRAFDRGMITFDEDLNLIVSERLNLPSMARPFFEDRKLSRPSRFAPAPGFLEYHRSKIFKGSKYA